MLKYYISLVIGLLLNVQTSFAQTPWQVDVGNIGKYPWNDICESYDKGVFILALDYSQQRKFSLLKTDADGKEIYHRNFKYEYPKGNKLSFATIARVTPSSDGGLYICGGVYYNDTFNNPLVAKLDACGEVAWSYVFKDNNPFPEGKYIMTINEIDSKNFILIAELTDYFLVIKFNDSGQVLNQNTIPNTLITYQTIQCKNHDYLTSGAMYVKSFTDTTDTITSYIRSTVVRIDTNGNLKWLNTYGLTEDSLSSPSYLFEYENKSRDIYLYGNHTTPFSPGQINHTYLKKCDSMGNQIWHKNMGQELTGKGRYFELPQAMLIFKDQNLLLAVSRQFGKFLEYSFARMVKVSPNGDVLDSVTLGDSLNFYNLTDAIQTYDNNILVAYSYFKTNKNNGTIHLRKFDSDLNQIQMTTTNFKYDSLCPHAVKTDDIDFSNSVIIPFEMDTTRIIKGHKFYPTVNAIPVILGKPQLKIFPNPFQAWIKVNIPKLQELTTVEIYDISGKIIYNDYLNPNGYINTEQLTKGIYFISLYNRNGERWDAKMIKE